MDIEKLKKELAREKKKIAELPSGRAKADYIWQYYKLWIIVCACVISLGSYVIYRYTTTLKENWFFITYTNTYAEVSNGSKLWEDFVAYTGYDTTVKNVEFNNNSYFDCATGHDVGNEYYQMFVAHTEAGTLDCVTMERESLEALGSTGRLLDLEDERVALIYEKYQDRLIYSVPYDETYEKDLVPVGIDISDSILMTQYHLYPDSCALGIGAYSTHLDAVEQFLEFIFMEAE